MTITPAETAAPSPTKVRPLSSFFVAPRGDGSRRRRGSDVTKLILAILLTLYFVVSLTSYQHFQVNIINAFYPTRHWLKTLVEVIWIIATFGTILIMVGVAAFCRRIEILRDLVVAVALAIATSYFIQQLFGVTANLPKSLEKSLAGVNLGFPVPIYAASVALVLVALPYLGRGFQRLLEGILALGILAGLGYGAGLPFSLLGSIVLGWGAASATHLIFGSPTGISAPSVVAENLKGFGLNFTSIEPVPHQEWGFARFQGKTDDGRLMRISLYGRDAQESQLFAKLYRSVFLRNDSRPFLLTRVAQVDHECYLTLIAATAASGPSEQVVASGLTGPDNDAVVVSAIPSGSSLLALIGQKETISDAALETLFGTIKGFGEKRFAHGGIDLNRILIDGDHASLIDFNQAQNYATDEAQLRDIAALLVAVSLGVGVERTLAAGVKVLGAQRVAQALAYVQDVALPNSLSSEVRKDHSRAILKELREQGAKVTNIEVPKLAELHRVSWTNMILALGTLIGGWALIGVFLHVAQSASTLENANWFWVVVVAVIAQLAYFGSGLATMGSVTSVMPYLLVVVLELSNTFAGLALGTPAVMAARIRFFQKQGIDTTIAVSSGVLTSTASWIVKGVLFLISIPFAISVIHISSLTGGKHGSDTKILEYLLVLVVGIGLIVALSLGVPRWRKLVKAQIVPRFKEVVDHFSVLIHLPTKIAEIFGGMFIAQITMALALGGALQAFGYHLSIPVLLFVLTIGSMLGGVSPVPGGMGVVEAGMILGLKAAGIPADVAVAAVFVQRLFTAYLPPIAGWFALMWLRRKEYL